MNPFVNPKKRSISLPGGCKDLADVLGRPDGTANSPIRRFINLVLMQAHQDGATELIIGVAPKGAEGTPIRYKVEGRPYDMQPFPSRLRSCVVSELRRMAGLRTRSFPQEGILSSPCGQTRLLWRIRIASRGAECVLSTADV